MPDRLSYDDAMLYADRNLKIQDPDIKQGAVETFIIKTSIGDLKKPWGLEGGFAVVYKFRTLSGQQKAMRCFRVAISPDTRSRYEKMSDFFRKYVPNITIDFHYYEDGILVKETQQSMHKAVLPVIVMEWVDGVTLLDKVDDLCKQRDTRTLGQLAEQWLELVNAMWQARMAHGDLAGVNVMVRTNGQLALIDYDGVYIPEFAGMPQLVLGQQGYQHPEMLLRPFNEQMDDFSALVIYLTLLALQAQPELWDRYVKRNSKGQLDGNMLFTRDDFEHPDTSPVLAGLFQSTDQQVRDLAHALRDACKQSIAQARFPSELRGADYLKKRALRQLEQAIKQDDYDQIVQQWDTHLKTYPPAQQYEPRVNEARRLKAAFDAFNNALASLNVFLISAAATPEITASPRLGPVERGLIALSRAFVDAYHSNDDDQIVNRWYEIQQGPFRNQLDIAPQERVRLELAEKRKAALTRFRKAYSGGARAHMIVSSYDPILDGSSALSVNDRKRLDEARRYIEMYNKIWPILQVDPASYRSAEVTRFMAAYDEELDKRFSNGFQPHERKNLLILTLYSRLGRALQARHDRFALVTAREIEKQLNAPMVDRRLSEARENFMKGIEVKNLRVQVRYGQTYISWDWPNDDLIDFAKLLWSYDRWPLHPHTDDPGRQELWVVRGVYEQYGGSSFAIGLTRQLYVQVYFAIKDYVEQTHEQHWIYSPGHEPTSRCMLQIAP